MFFPHNISYGLSLNALEYPMSSKEQNICYVGIPLPRKLDPDFDRLLTKVNKICPKLELTNHRPHLTLLHFVGQLDSTPKKIVEVTKPILPIIRGKHISVGGFGTFRNNVYFLQTPSLPIEVHKFRTHLVNALGEGHHAPFFTHITVCKDPTNSLNDRMRYQIATLFNSINWNFPITDLDIQGLKQKSFTPNDFQSIINP